MRRPEDLSLEVFEAVVWQDRKLYLHPDLLADLAGARGRMLGILAESPDVYGITTGMGYLAGIRLTESDQQNHQAHLLLGRAVGGPPYLEPEETRAVLLARLAGFLGGNAGVTPELCCFLAARLNDRFIPAVPRTGIGCAGEIIPLAHAFQTFSGVGEVLESGGRRGAAADALAARGAAPYRPELKEGIALLAGSPGALALIIAHRRVAATLARQLLVAAACVIDALRAPLSPYDAAIAELSNDATMSLVLQRLGTLLTGSSSERQARQAPVSFRVIPQVLSHLEVVVSRAEQDARRALLAVTDSPAFHDDRFVTSGAFHAIGLTSNLDQLAIALVQAAELSGQHIHRMLDHRFSGLPDQLTARPGLNAGLIVVHKRVVGTLNELRRLAAPAGVGLADTSLGQEDAMSFEFEAAEKLRRIEELVREVIACQLLVVRQAWALRDLPVAAGLDEIHTEITNAVGVVDTDRPLGSDISALIALLASGHFSGTAISRFHV